MSDKKEESLKPCPFCGKRDYFPCADSYVDCKCLSGQFGVDMDKWNNAYCWKETDSLKARIEDIEKMNSVQKKRIEETWELNQRYEKALKEILDVNTQWGTEIPVKTYGIAKEALGKVCDPGLGAKPIIGC